MARDIVSTILDLQLRQLEENSLTHLTIYGDIKGMRGEIDTLVKSEMPEVIELLVKMQKGSREERERYFGEVRTKVREIIVTLSTERQKLLRRLRIAKLESQIRQLIERQSAVRQATTMLLSRPEPHARDGDARGAVRTSAILPRSIKDLNPRWPTLALGAAKSAPRRSPASPNSARSGSPAKSITPSKRSTAGPAIATPRNSNDSTPRPRARPKSLTPWLDCCHASPRLATRSKGTASPRWSACGR